MKLYIIGNGFDLWHDLPTNLEDFQVFAEEQLKDLEMFYLQDYSKKGLWSDLEKSLGGFDWKGFFEYHEGTDVTSDNFKVSDTYSLQDDLAEQSRHHVEAIRDAFREWIDEIDISGVLKKMEFPKDSNFITFNYTSTLQTVYGIDEKNVFHIHGRAENFDDLIFGHGETMEEEPEEDEDGNSNRTLFTDSENAAKYPFFVLQKPVSEIINKNSQIFASAGTASEIIVVGHSLNDIDLPYFKELAARAPSAGWRVCCHTKLDEDQSTQQLLRCGIERVNIVTFGYAEFCKCLDYASTRPC